MTMNRRSLTSVGTRKGLCIQKRLSVRFHPLATFWFASIAFSAPAAFAQANFRPALESSNSRTVMRYSISSGGDRVINQYVATDGQVTLASRITRAQTTDATAPEALAEARGSRQSPIPKTSTAVQLVGGLAFLLWIQRSRRYWA